MDQNFDYVPNTDPINTGFDPIPPSPPSKAHKSYAIASLVLGIASVATCCCCCMCGLVFVPLICGILAVIFAIVSMKKAPDKKMPGMAIAGLILGIIGILLALFLIALLFSIPTIIDEEFWIEYEAMLREELGDEMFEEFFGTYMPSEALQ